MALALNTSKISDIKSRRHHATVIPAAVWDPRAPHPVAHKHNSFGGQVRTLRVEHSGDFSKGNRLSQVHAEFVPRATPFANQSASVAAPSTVLSTFGVYILGAICGIGLFVGTIVGADIAADNAPINGYSAGGVAVSTR